MAYDLELQDVTVASSQNSHERSEEMKNKFLQGCKYLGRPHHELVNVKDLLNMIKDLNANQVKTNEMNVFHLLICDSEGRWSVKEFDTESAAKVVQIIREIGNR